MDYRVPFLRRAALALHAALYAVARGLERARDLGVGLFWVLIVLAVIGFGGAAYLPITDGLADVAVWIAVWLLLNVGLVRVLRAARRRRYGAAPSKYICGKRDVLWLMLAGWVGACGLFVFVYDALSAESHGWAGGAGLLAGFTLIPLGILLYRYVTEPPEDDAT